MWHHVVTTLILSRININIQGPQNLKSYVVQSINWNLGNLSTPHSHIYQHGELAAPQVYIFRILPVENMFNFVYDCKANLLFQIMN